MRFGSREMNILGAFVTAGSDALAGRMSDETGLTLAQASVLMTVLAYPGDSIEELAPTLGLTHSGAVRLIGGLAERGLVDKRRGRDGRAVAVHLTDAGRELAERACRARESALEEMTGGLPAAERAALTGLLERLLSSIDAGRRWADHTCRLCEVAVCPQESCPVAREDAR